MLGGWVGGWVRNTENKAQLRLAVAGALPELGNISNNSSSNNNNNNNNNNNSNKSNITTTNNNDNNNNNNVNDNIKKDIFEFKRPNKMFSPFIFVKEESYS